MYHLLIALSFVGFLTATLNGQPYQFRHLLNGHQSAVTFLCLRGEDNLLASGSASGSIILWDIEQGKPASRLKGHSGQITHLEFSPNGKHLASASHDGTIRIWNIDNESLEQTIEVPGVSPYADVQGNEPTFLAYNLSGSCLFFGGYNAQIHKATLKDGKLTQLYEHPEFGITSGLLAGDGKVLLFAAGAVTYAMDIQNEQIIKTFKVADEDDVNAYVCEIAISSGHLLAAWTYGGTVDFYSLKGGQHKYALKGTNQEGSSNLSFSADGSFLVTGNCENDVKLWEVEQRKVVQQLSKHKKRVTSFTISQDDKYIVTGADDNQVAVWVRQNSDKKYKKLPNELENRKNEVQATIETKEASSIIKLWDNKTVDGDVISVYFNGNRVLAEHRLNKLQKELPLPLKKGLNWVVIYAHNLGDTPPNTIGAKIIQGTEETREYTFRSDEKENATIVIMRK